MKHFLLHQVHEVDLYVEAESEEKALEKWSHAPCITLEDENGETIEPSAQGYEDLYGECIESTIVEVDENGHRVEVEHGIASQEQLDAFNRALRAFREGEGKA